MSETVGNIDLQLGINQNDFNRQLGNIQNTAQRTGNILSNALTGGGNIADTVNKTVTNPLKFGLNSIGNGFSKLGSLIAGAFAVNSIKEFVSSCLDLGSDLAEVQNVVDVTFSSMADSVNAFSKNAMTQFGLSETVAKKYMGTFGAMSKAFGFTEQQSYDMAKAVTGLTADVASFYNLSSDEAYYKMKSIWTGETESLKDLGVVMTQTALDQYALANGYDKTTAKMSEQEKVALRYQFVLEQLSLAQGDFSRTSDGWANQTRVLALRFDSLKASLGQGFINAFTPIIQSINLLLSKLQILADKFKDFTENIFGNRGNNDTSADVLSGSLSNATENSNALGDSAVKTSKKLKSLMGFDEINRLSDNSDDTESTANNIEIPTIDDLNPNEGLDITTGKLKDILKFLNKIKDIAKSIANIFLKGFKIGFGNTNFDNIKKSLQSIKYALIDIFTNSKVLNSTKNWAKSVIFNLGEVTGSIASIGVTIAELLVGSFEKYLTQNKDRIVTAITTMLDISTEINNLIGDLFVSIADIFTVFRSNDAKQIGADIINIFATTFSTLNLIVSIAIKNIISTFAKPIVDNTNKLKEVFNGLLSILKTVSSNISGIFSATGDTFNVVYQEKLKPAYDKIFNVSSEVFSTLCDVINKDVLPVLQSLANKFKDISEKYIKPAIEDIINTLGDIVENVSIFMDTVIKPIANFIIKNIVPPIIEVFKFLSSTILDIIGLIVNVFKNLVGIIGDYISIIVGIVTGDGEKVKNAIKDIIDRLNDNFLSLVDTIKAIFKDAWNSITSIFNLDSVKSHFDSIMDSISNSVKGGLNTLIDWVNGAIDRLNSFQIDIPDWLTELTGLQTFGLNIPNIPKLANGGIVKQPTLAMVGEYSGANSNPEVIAPLDKLTSLMASKSNNADIVSALERIAELLVNQKEPQVTVMLSDNDISNAMLRYNVKTGGK